jgi:hypothetical protein
MSGCPLNQWMSRGRDEDAVRSELGQAQLDISLLERWIPWDRGPCE